MIAQAAWDLEDFRKRIREMPDEKLIRYGKRPLHGGMAFIGLGGSFQKVTAAASNPMKAINTPGQNGQCRHTVH